MEREPDATEAAVLAQLDRLGVPFEAVEIDPDLADTADFCAHYGYALEDSANCIIVASRKVEPVRYAACVVLAHTRLDVNNRVRKLMEVRRLSFASAEQTRELTGMMIGGVTPFALPDDLPIHVDARVRDRERVIVGGGSRSLKLLVPPDAFDRLPAAGFVDDLAVPPT